MANLTTQFKDNTGVRLVAADARQIDLESLAHRQLACPFCGTLNAPYKVVAKSFSSRTMPQPPSFGVSYRRLTNLG